MLNFLAPRIEDACSAVPIISNSEVLGCDASFANIFLWQKKYNIRLCRFENFILKLYGSDYDLSYAFPVGSGDPCSAIDEILKDAEERGIIPVIVEVTEYSKLFLEEKYSGKFLFEENRDSSDYIYLRENLADLPGKKYQKKRNHISRFLRTYKNYSFVEINDNNFNDALKVARGWCALHGVCAVERGLDAEFCAIRSAFDNYEKLNLFGGILYIDGTPAAMTVASEINSQICDTHFEKALDYDGAYAMINREFARNFTKYKYINREEDMGLEGLRKAKLSYHPDILLTKYTARAVK